MRALFFVLTAFVAGAAPAQAPGRFVGNYVADVREAPAEAGLASAIALNPDGTFDWTFTVHGLALAARGEWHDDGGRIDLSNPFQYPHPTAELVASARDGEGGILVSLEPETRRMASALEVEAEFPDNVFARFPLAQGEVRIPATDPPVVAVRLFSEQFSYRSEPFALAAGGDNRLTLRLVPADFGQAYFSSQSMGWAEDGGTLQWRGIALRYDRDGVHATPGQIAARQSLAGVYVADRMETATALELGDDGRFVWMFSMGALDVGAMGRWRSDGDTVLLDSDPVTPPAFELVSTEPAADRVVRVRVDPESRSALAFLDIELEYADGTREREHFRGPGFPIPLDGARRVVAYRLGSSAFAFQAERVPMPADGALRVYRFVPNDIGLEDFRGQRLAISGRELSLDWRGETLRYARVDAPLAPTPASEESGVLDAPPDETGLMDAGESVVDVPGPVQPWDASESTPSAGRIDYVLGEPIAATAARSSYPLDGRYSHSGLPGVAELRVRIGERSHDFGRISMLSWRLDGDADSGSIGAFSFYAQDRMLALGEALARARSVLAWLEQSGFAPGAPEDSTFAPFRLIDPYRYDETVAGWDEAATLLADEDQGVQGLDLFMMHAPGWYAQASVTNMTRTPDGSGVATSGGREWVLSIELFRDPATFLAPGSDIGE